MRKFIFVSGILILTVLSAGYYLYFRESAVAAGNDSYTVSMLHMNGSDASTTFTDEASAGSHTWTAQNQAQIDTAQNKFGGASGLFDGTDDYLTAADSADWDFGTGDFTIDGWVRIPNTQGGTVIGHNEGANGEWEVYVNGTNNYIGFEGSFTDATAINVRDTNYTISTNTWTHFAIVRSGNTLTLYVNGVAHGTQDATGKTLNMIPTGGIGIGARNNGTSDYNGWIDEARVSKGIARWTADFTIAGVPNEEYTLAKCNDTQTVSLLHGNGSDAATTFTDDGENATHTWVAKGNAQLDTAQYKFGTASLLLDGTGDYATTTDSADWNFGSGDFTIDFWVRFNVLPSSQEMNIVNQEVDTSNKWRFTAYDSAGTKYWYFRALGTGIDLEMIKQTTLSTGVWYHVALVRTGNTWKIFEGGTQVGTDSTNSGTMPDLAAALRIGLGAEVGTIDFNGWIDEIRISKGIARWTANFTVPSGEYCQPGAPIIPDDMIVFE